METVQAATIPPCPEPKHQPPSCAPSSGPIRRPSSATRAGSIRPSWPSCCGRSWDASGCWRAWVEAPPTRPPSGQRRGRWRSASMSRWSSSTRTSSRIPTISRIRRTVASSARRSCGAGSSRRRGLAIVCDGTNADDLREHRPGYAAGQAAGVRSPLAEAGLTKADVRHAARELGLPVWDAPAAPCLSSRVAYGIPITSQRLAQVERAEAYLRQLGVTGDLRVRHHGDRGRARIEVEARWVPWVTERLPAIKERLTALGFAVVEVDPRGYRRGGLLAERA